MSNVLQLTGIHHVSARTRQIGVNHDFYTRVLNLRLVKKSVNQDDTRMYHLFYGDQVGTPGSGMTFFDFPQAAREHKGGNSITRTTFRVTGNEALSFWAERLTEHGFANSGVVTLDGRGHIHFEDPDGTPLSLVEDGGQGPRGVVRPNSDVPEAFQIQGLGYGGITVSDLAPTRDFFERGLNLREVRQYPVPGAETFTVHVFEMGTETGAGPHAELHITERNDLPRTQPGAGGVHHIALRIPDAVGMQPWLEHLNREGFKNTGLVDRYYFRSVYLRDPHGIVIELATDGPGFHADESIDSLGDTLALPPFLEPNRAAIEANLRPIVSGPASIK
ncbi:MAG: VOC family protein [Armatimonadota bacterium]